MAETRRKSNWPSSWTQGYRRRVHPARKVPWPILTVAATSLVGCTTIDPGNDYAVAPETFDADYFYCHVEPGFIFQQNCGPGIASDNGSCHFSAAVSGMNLQAHPAIDCAGEIIPLSTHRELGAPGPEAPLRATSRASRSK